VDSDVARAGYLASAEWLGHAAYYRSLSAGRHCVLLATRPRSGAETPVRAGALRSTAHDATLQIAQHRQHGRTCHQRLGHLAPYWCIRQVCATPDTPALTPRCIRQVRAALETPAFTPGSLTDRLAAVFRPLFRAIRSIPDLPDAPLMLSRCQAGYRRAPPSRSPRPQSTPVQARYAGGSAQRSRSYRLRISS
jgi:hypothetical protein